VVMRKEREGKPAWDLRACQLEPAVDHTRRIERLPEFDDRCVRQPDARTMDKRRKASCLLSGPARAVRAKTAPPHRFGDTLTDQSRPGDPTS